MTVDALPDGAGRLQAMCTWFDRAIRISNLFELHSFRSLEDVVPRGVTVSRLLDLEPQH